jgi:hypothetical protein
MKLRIRGNSIRFRLTQSEVEEIGKRGQVEDAIEFGRSASEKLTYALVLSDKTAEIGSKYDSGKIAVIIPKTLAEEWINTEQTSISGEQILGKDKSSLNILIEKDFACLSERAGEDESDNFPNPNAGNAC